MVILDDKQNSGNITLICKCSFCGETGIYYMNKEESDTLMKYRVNQPLTPLSELFPKVPAWIRAGAIDTLSNGKCQCPKCINKN